MQKEIKFSLVYRDMWQSAGKFMPRKDQLVQVAEPIIKMGCFERVETNGGGFEQINLLYGENPNHSVREWTQPFNDHGIQTHMLERGLNGIRMSPVSKDLRHLMFKLKKIQGTDIARSFDGLNNPQNLALSFQYAKEGGMIPQGALSITFSPIHTVEYYINLAEEYINLGAEEICIKDMAGIGRPVSIGKIVRGIRKRHPNIIIQYHGHSTPGFSVASSLEAARAGVDFIDVSMEPLSWGTGHADLLTIHAMLKDAGFAVPEINMEAYMEVRALTQSFIDDFLGYFISPKNRLMNSLLIGPGLPGGMMGSLMADLEINLKSINKWLDKNQKDKISQDKLLIMLFEEVKYVWPRLGYPCLVTPFSQYVKNTALLNVMQTIKGRERWSMLDENTWSMILGKSGKLPGQLDEEILQLAKKQNREFYTGNPQDLYPDVLASFENKMKDKGWEVGPDQEELFEYAMHPAQYEDYKSGLAKEKFTKALNDKKSTAAVSQSADRPKKVTISLDGNQYEVDLSWKGGTGDLNAGTQSHSGNDDDSTLHSVIAPIQGKFFKKSNPSEKVVKVGDQVKKGDTLGYIESMKVLNAITSDAAGEVVKICFNNGEDVDEDDVIIKLRPN